MRYAGTLVALAVLLVSCGGSADRAAPDADPEPAANASNEIDVGTTPVILRGRNASGEKIVLIGLPDALSFEYRAEDIRLLAVRAGPLARRSEDGRLTPLGEILHRPAAAQGPAPTFRAGPEIDFTHRLSKTWVEAGVAGISYDLVRGDDVVASVRETVGALSLSDGPAYSRKFAITPDGVDREVIFLAAAAGERSFVYISQDGIGRFRAALLAPDGSFDFVFAAMPKTATLLPGLDLAFRLPLRDGAHCALHVAPMRARFEEQLLDAAAREAFR